MSTADPDSDARVDLAHFDELYSTKAIEALHSKLLAALEGKADDFELQWRASRSHCDVADMKPDDANHRQTHYLAAVTHAERALELDDKNCMSHKWVAISLGESSKFKGTKQKIEDSHRIKTHGDIAAGMNPDDASTQILLGMFCISVMKLSWVERQAASIFFATPPTSTHEEALGYFLRASELKPDVRNATYIGDCYIALKNPIEAKAWYSKAVELPTLSATDSKFQEVAKTSLSQLK